MLHRFRTLILAFVALLFVSAPSPAAQQYLNLSTPNSGAGTPLRDGGAIINANFTDLYAFLYAPITGDVTIPSGSNTATITSGSITLPKFFQFPAGATLCNPNAFAALPQYCTPAQEASILNIGTFVNSVAATAPTGLTANVTDTAGAVSITLGWATGLSPNQFFGTPCSGTGTISLRGLCSADIPPINLASDNTNGGVTGNIDASHFNSGSGANSSTFLRGDMTWAAPPGSTGAYNHSELCSQSGVDPTGATDSGAAFATWIATLAGTNVVGTVNCPVLVHVGTTQTGQYFIPGSIRIEFGSSGEIRVDNCGNPEFMLVNVTNITFVNSRWNYVNTTCAAQMINMGAAVPGGGGTVWNSWPNPVNDTSVPNYLNGRFTGMFSGGHSQWPGTFNYLAIFDLVGQVSNVNFVGGNTRFYSTASTAAGYAYSFFAFNQGWNSCAGCGITTSTTVTAQNSSVPTDIWIADATVDYVSMFVTGDCIRCHFINLHSVHYSDSQDGTTGTVTFTGTSVPANFNNSGGTLALASAWGFGTGTVNVLLSNGQIIGMPLTHGSTAIGTFTQSTNNVSSSVTGTTLFYFAFTSTIGSGSTGSGLALAANWPWPSGTYWFTTDCGNIIGSAFTQGATTVGTFGGATTCANSTPYAYTGNPGDVNGTGSNTIPSNTNSIQTAPPHLLYLTTGGNVYHPQFDVQNMVDDGLYAGTPLMRNSTSGSTLSLKVDPGTGSTVNGALLNRPTGTMDILSFTGEQASGSFRSIVANPDTSYPTADGGCLWGVRYPQGGPFVHFSMDNVTITDLNPAPCKEIFGGNLVNGNQDISITNIHIYENDYPVGASWSPGTMVWGGEQIKIKADYHFAACNNQATLKGVFVIPNSITMNDTDTDIELFGWRVLSGTFTAALSSNATSANLGTPSSFLGPTSTYTVTFSDGEQRTVSMTNGGTSMTWTPGLTAGVTTAYTVTGLFGTNPDGFKNRVNMSGGGLNASNHLHVYDANNNYETFVDGGITREYWTQFQYVFGSQVTGTNSFTTGINIPKSMAIDAYSLGVKPAFTGGSTSLSMTCTTGCTTNPFTGAQAVPSNSVQYTQFPIFAPFQLSNTSTSSIQVTAAGGNFDSSGAFQVSVRAAKILTNY